LAQLKLGGARLAYALNRALDPGAGTGTPMPPPLAGGRPDAAAYFAQADSLRADPGADTALAAPIAKAGGDSCPGKRRKKAALGLFVALANWNFSDAWPYNQIDALPFRRSLFRGLPRRQPRAHRLHHGRCRLAYRLPGACARGQGRSGPRRGGKAPGRRRQGL